MKLMSVNFLAIAGIALLLIGVMAGGCGEDSQGSQADGGNGLSYNEVIHGLKNAALAKEPYKSAILHADLNAVQAAVIHSFCEFAWQIWVNKEAYKLSGGLYVVGRVKTPITYEIDGHRQAIDAAINELGKGIDLASLDEDQLRSYSRACYH
jgi:hypothetical protein